MQTTAQNEDRVKEATPSSVNKKIESETWQRVTAEMGKANGEISKRINELNKEWDIERYLAVNMSTLAIIGLGAGVATKNKKWLILPAVVLGFFMQHAIQGWCPPLAVLRKLKIRSSKEIEQEKYALKILRGDFTNVQSSSIQNIETLKQAVTKG
jgi:hypothetical protein